VRAVVDTLQRLAGTTGRSIDETTFRRALLAGYPDRVARRRTPGTPRVLLSSGHGAVVGPESGVRDSEFLLALDVTAGPRGEGSEARIRMASAIEREWLVATDTRVEHTYDSGADVVRAASRDYYDALVLVDRPIALDPTETERLLTNAFLARALTDEDERFMRRLRFAGVEIDLETIAARSAAGCRSLCEMALSSGLSGDERRRLEKLAPSSIAVPSGRHATLEYQDDGSIVAAVKLQELFGLADTPRVGPRQTPVLLSLLAPNGRPVQMTRDLRSFWERTYPEVRKELRGRYPKHPWPEDPWSAPPTARTTRRGVK
jgi:ATP-dependent helicase HrpB